VSDTRKIKNRALYLSLIEILMAKGVLSEVDMKGIRNESDLAVLLIERGVIDVEDLNVLMIKYKGFLSGILTVFKEPVVRERHLSDLKKKYGIKYPKILSFVESMLVSKE